MWISAAPYHRCHPPLTGVSLTASGVADDDGDDGGGGGQPGGLWTHAANEPVEAAAMFASVLIYALPWVQLDQSENSALYLFLLEFCAQFSKL